MQPVPVHVATLPSLVPASLASVASAPESVGGFDVIVGVGAGAASAPASPVSITSLLSLPQPTAIPAPMIIAEPVK
jgi:hypothetical protein